MSFPRDFELSISCNVPATTEQYSPPAGMTCASAALGPALEGCANRFIFHPLDGSALDVRFAADEKTHIFVVLYIPDPSLPVSATPPYRLIKFARIVP
jgi:hypothetical protein